ncbi:hypothetical protein CDD83_6941 [Cordyceps sp. RAO-2017]|nr:hypothetical protein CDD83_6941 [Cordyceps sp. RAO-2017]
MGPKGHRINAEAPVQIVGENIVYRGDEKPELDDLAFWKRRLHPLDAKYGELHRTIYPPPESAHMGEEAQAEQDKIDDYFSL